MKRFCLPVVLSCLSPPLSAQEFNLNNLSTEHIEPSAINQFPFAEADPSQTRLFPSPSRNPAQPFALQAQDLFMQSAETLGVQLRSPDALAQTNPEILIDLARTIETTDPMGAVNAYQAAGVENWQQIIATTDFSTFLAAQTELGTYDIPALIGAYSMADRNGTVSAFEGLDFDLETGEMLWRIDGVEIPLALNESPFNETILRATDDVLPAILAGFDFEAAEDWGTAFEAIPAGRLLSGDIDWQSLQSTISQSNNYAAFDKYLSENPLQRDLIGFDFTPETRIAGLEGSDLSSLQQVQLGSAYLELGEVDLAAASYRNALNLDEGNEDALVGLAQVAVTYQGVQFASGGFTPEDAAEYLWSRHQAGNLDASIALINPPAPMISDERALQASATVAQNATDSAIRMQAREVQRSRCSVGTENDDRAITCAFFPLIYVTTREPTRMGERINFGITAAPDFAVSYDILVNDVVMETAIPSGDANWIARGSCVARRYCYENDVLNPQPNNDLPREQRGFRSSSYADRGPLTGAIGELENAFGSLLAKTLSDDDAADALPPRAVVFIHGFNTEFSEAVDTLTNLMITARYPATPYLLSWPSQGRLAISGDITEGTISLGLQHTYQADRDAVTASCPAMSAALFEILDHYEPGNVDLVVHSMGNQLLYEIFTGCDPDKPAPGEDHPIRYLILSSPDLGLANFQNAIGLYQSHARQTFIYGTERDLVLDVSQVLNQSFGDQLRARVPRVGFFADQPLEAPGVQWINLVTVDNFSPDAPANHSHFINTPAVRKDIAMILNDHAEDGAERCLLPTNVSDTFFYISRSCL